MIKLLKDILLLVVLFIAASKIGNTQELPDDGGIRLKNGCYTLVIVTEDKEKKIITVQDCRGGRPI